VPAKKALALGCFALLNRQTMRRICVIGDSHVAALKLGWEALRAELPGLQLDFYAAPKPHMGGFAVEDGKLIATTATLKKFLEQTAEGRFSIDGSYALYLVCGIGAGIETVVPAVKKLLTGDFETGEEDPDDQARRAFARLLRDAEASVFLEKVRAITEAPVALIAKPFGSAGVLAKMLRAAGEDRRVVDLYEQAFDRVLRKRSRARFLSQPAETLGDSPLATAEQFFRQPARLAVQDAEGDGRHANGDYGAIVLRSALTRMAVLS
jgi:hypothetical protein